jgi:hypothetical protein
MKCVDSLQHFKIFCISPEARSISCYAVSQVQQGAVIMNEHSLLSCHKHSSALKRVPETVNLHKKYSRTNGTNLLMRSASLLQSRELKATFPGRNDVILGWNN